MTMTRRAFLGTTAAALSAGGNRRGPGDCVVLDLKGACLRESVAGYQAVLGQIVPRCATLIVPGALEIAASVAREVVTGLRAGATVILESAAGFVAERDFRGQRDILRSVLGVHIDTALQLWPRGVPYIDYNWPFPAKIRDFSRAVRLPRQPGAMIAAVDGVPVALRRRIGRGTLIVLGSPLGPALW